MVKPRRTVPLRKNNINFINPNPPPLFQMKKVKKDLYGFFNNSIGKDISNVKNYGKREVKNVVAFSTTEFKKVKKATKKELKSAYTDFLKPLTKQQRKIEFLPIESRDINFMPPKKYPARTPAEIKLIDKDPWGDKDKDKVPNWFDCKPKKKSEQGFMTKVTKKSLKRYRPQVERIAKRMEKRLIPIQAELTKIGNRITEEKERVAEKRAEREAKRLLLQGVPMSKIREGIAIDLSTIPTDPALQKELEKTASKFQAEYLGYHSAINVLREEPNPLRKMLIKKEGDEKRVIGFIYEDPHVLARRKGFMPEVKAEARKIEEQYLIKEMQDRIPDEWGMPKKDIKISKQLKLAPYKSPIETGVATTSDVTGKIGELAASRVLKRKLSPEELKSHIELDTVYIVPEERGKGYGKKVIESLMKRPGLKKITASGEKEVYGKAWAPTGAIQKEFDPSAAVDLSKDRGLTESEKEAEEFAEKLKEGHVDFEWNKEPAKLKKEEDAKYLKQAIQLRAKMAKQRGMKVEDVVNPLSEFISVVRGPVKDEKSGTWSFKNEGNGKDIFLETDIHEEALDNLKKQKKELDDFRTEPDDEFAIDRKSGYDAATSTKEEAEFESNKSESSSEDKDKGERSDEEAP